MDGCRQGKLAATACALLLAWSNTIPAWAQNSDNPNKPATMIVPFPPGGLADTVARPIGDLRPIARFTADPTVLAVRADAPRNTVQDFVEDARKRPGAIDYGSSGSYGTMHVPTEMLVQDDARRKVDVVRRIGKVE